MEKFRTLALSSDTGVELEDGSGEASTRKPMVLNRMQSFEPDLPLQVPSEEPYTEPERWRYLAGDGRDFLPKPEEWPTRKIKDHTSDGTFLTKPSTAHPGTLVIEKEKPNKCGFCSKRYKSLNGLKNHKQHSSCNLDLKLSNHLPATGFSQLSVEGSVPPSNGDSPPPSPLRSPGFDGDFDDCGEIPYMRAKPATPPPPSRRDTSRSYGSDTDDDDHIPAVPRQQIPAEPAYIPPRRRSRSRACDIAYVDNNGNCIRNGSPKPSREYSLSPSLLYITNPGYDGDFDKHGEIPYQHIPPQHEPSLPSLQRRDSFARSIGSDNDDGSLFPPAHRQIPVTAGDISRQSPQHRNGCRTREGSRGRYRISSRERKSLDHGGQCHRSSRQIIHFDGDSIGKVPLDDESEFLNRRPLEFHRMRSYDMIPGPFRRSVGENVPTSQSKTDSSLWGHPVSSKSVDIDTYKYESLDSSANQIRLIKLEPKNSTMVNASLFITSLDNAPKYDALSYTWGNPRKCSLIILNDTPFQVTQNLGTALEKLQGTETRILWIDAICINQKDDNERSDQVTKMRKIYAQASTVVVWLGDHSEYSAMAFALLKEMDAKFDDKPSIEIILNSKDNLDALQGISKIMSREYWWRIWVIQEVHFAPEVLVHCGDSKIQWGKMLRLQEKLSTEFGGVLHHLSTFYPSLRDFSTAIKFRGPSSLVVNRSYPSRAQDPATVPTLFEALLMHRLKHSTDPRDKIYALVGLTTARSDPSFQIDYSCSVRKVYIDTASYILKASHTLDFLCAKTKGNEFPKDIPSWCPDWASTGANCPIPFRHATSAGIYSASKRRSPIAEIDTSTGILSAKGIYVRTVRDVSPPCGMRSIVDSQNTLQTLHSWFQFVYLEVGSSKEVHTRFLTLVLGADEKTEITSLIEYLVKYLGLIDYWVVPPPLPKEVEHLSQVLSQSFFQRRLFVTEEGEFGLTEKGVRERDKICILFGCSSPVVLREGSEEEGYEFIGDTLLQGWMFGTGIEQLEKGFYREENFLLGG